MWSAMQSALCTDEKVHRAKHRWVLQLGKPAGNQHMDPQAATLQDSGCLCCATSALGTPQGRACGHSCARGKFPRAVQGILSWCCLLALTVQLSKIPNHSFGRGTHHLGWLSVPIPHLPLHPLCSRELTLVLVWRSRWQLSNVLLWSHMDIFFLHADTPGSSAFSTGPSAALCCTCCRGY